MGMILLSCFLDSLILFWYNRKNNSSHLVLKFLACYISLILLTNILNQFDFSTFLYRLFPNFIVYTLLLFFISQKREWNKIILKAILLMSSVVFSELSIEACERIGEGRQKTISLVVNTIENFIFIKISNPVDIVKKEGGRLFSIKRKQQEEGLGLMCLQETLKKYNGSYSYEIVDHLFNVTIVIPDNH